MEGHSGKPLYLTENPQPFRRLGIFVVCGMLFYALRLDASYPMWYKEDASEDSTP